MSGGGFPLGRGSRASLGQLDDMAFGIAKDGAAPPRAGMRIDHGART